MQQNFISVVSALPAGRLSGLIRAQKAAKPFSWVEESNMYWALWHLRHYSDLHNYASRQNWPEESMKKVKEHLTWNEIEDLTAEVISTVAAVLSDLGLSPIYSYPYLSEHEESIQGVWWYPSETPPPLFHSFDLEGSMDIAVWPLPPIPSDGIVTDMWILDVRGCGRTVPHLGWYKDRSRMLAYNGPNPNFTMLRIQPYRRLGVFIWDVWRMYSTGLIHWNGPSYSALIPGPDGDAEVLELVGVQFVPMGEWHSRWITPACWGYVLKHSEHSKKRKENLKEYVI
ncbi:hypothetical protein N7517_006655 [Penicillium concentricum]|uniref:Uncharacterized protein n=1 Tax=Penicillium concentricum TaxID=293559 RepID=A0A9W9VBJ4_9EURO|nr:uncharacterized protein N7517_006655 [Penicillium concentricum]KAJ5374649.1 hypothetical protein N7517_006655 [Penicillium concentricum]